MSRRFIIGVELLTGLSIGAAAAAAAVAFMTAFLVSRDLGSESGHMATVTAYAVGRSLQDTDPREYLERVVDPLVSSGSLQGAVVISPDGTLLASSGEIDSSTPVPEEDDDWYFAQLPESGLLVGVSPGTASLSVLYRALIIGLASLTAALAVLAFFTPRYLSRTVISPLREILMEADRFTTGGGSDPETAGASFHRLVELLHERERQLNEMREKAEARADRIEKRSAAVLSVLGSALFAIDNGGSLLLFNRQSEELFGLDYQDTGKVFPWERTEAGRRLRPLVNLPDGSSVMSAEFQLTGESGRGERIFSVEISRARSEETAVLVTDVTRIGELERRIADQTAMADLGAASAGISHEMGNTLCALSGFVDLLARGHSDMRTLKILSEVRQEVESAQALIESFGSFSKSPQPVTSKLGRDELRDIFEKACKPYPGRCSIELEVEGITLDADAKLLASCIRNLVRNAAEADDSSSIKIELTAERADAIIAVTDTGPGFSMDCEDMFRPFMTTKDRSSGNMGLGLSVSRRIIRSMGGELTGKSRKGGGAVFEIVLPIMVDAEVDK
jgi:signal transduction histidine kinase